MAGLLKYFCHNVQQKVDRKDEVLPDPNGGLSEKIPFSLIQLTNNIVQEILETTTWRIFQLHSSSEAINRKVSCREWGHSSTKILR